MKNLLLFVFVMIVSCGYADGPDRECAKRLRGKRVLVFCGYGEGFVHDNIQASTEMFLQLGEEYGFVADSSSEIAVFNRKSLRCYDVIVFANASYVDFTEQERIAFQNFIRNGGGFVGIHAAICTGNKWEWFTRMIGGCFAGHPHLQEFTVKNTPEGRENGIALPDTLTVADELYLFRLANPDIRVLAVSETGGLDWEPGDTPGDLPPEVPTVWYKDFEGGRVWYTALGHRETDYSQAWYREHVIRGLCRVVGKQ